MIFSKPSQKFIAEFFRLTRPTQKIVITGHHDPDDDSVASAIALRRAILKKFPEKSVKIIMIGKKKEISFSKEEVFFAKDIYPYLKEADALIAVDAARYDRFTDFPEKISLFSGIKICIDHHASRPDKFNMGLVVSGAPSCAELIYTAFFKKTGMDKELAEIFLAGILSDTGYLSYIEPKNFKTILTTEKLLKVYGKSLEQFRTEHNPIEKKILKISAEILKNNSYAKINGWPECQYSYVSRRFLSNDHHNEEDVHEALDIFERQYIRSTKGCTWGFVLRPQGNNCKISLRSLPGSVNVRRIMEKMEIGGGHDRAAGGAFKNTTPEQALKIFFNWMKKNKPEY